MKRFIAAVLVGSFFLLAATTQIDYVTQIKNKPSFATVATTGAYSDLTGRPGTWNDPGSGTLLKRTGAFTFAAAVSNTDYQAALGFTPENAANKSAANGYAGLNASSIVPTANLPSCVASGASHASGLVPDPGASAGTTKFLREDCTFVAPSNVVTTQSNPARVIGTVYQNTGSKPIFVAVGITLGATSQNGVRFETDGSNPPTSSVGIVFENGTTASSKSATITAIVLPGNFYKLVQLGSATTTIDTWVEWN